jgi:hypothetical protein
MSQSILPEKEFTILFRRPLLRQEYRAAKRYCCGRAPVLVHVLLEPEDREAWASNLSETGIGLNLPYRLEVGSAVVLRLRGGWWPAKSVSMPARVIHATEQEDGTWQVGCAFERRLDAETVEALL